MAYHGWLVSDSMITRAFGVLLHYALAQLIIMILIFGAILGG